MPIKSQKKNKGRKVQKKRNTGKIILISAAALCILIVLSYLMFSRSSTSEQKAISGSVQDQQNVSGPAGESLSLEDRLSMLNKAKLQLESVDNKDIVRVLIEKSTGTSGENISHKYEWSINGQPAGNGSDSVSGFKRGDKVAVKITPFDGEKPGRSRTLTVEVQNSTPKVSESKEPKYDGKTFAAQVNASDPDGDTLSYELLSGPEGMTIDRNSGMVNWPVKENTVGDYPVKVKITDGHGGEITYQLTATIPKETPPPATPPAPQPKKSP